MASPSSPAPPGGKLIFVAENLPIDAPHVHHRSDNVRRRRRGAPTEAARESLNADLPDPEPVQHRLDRQLGSDERAARLEPNVAEDRPPDHAKSSRDVAKGCSEHEA